MKESVSQLVYVAKGHFDKQFEHPDHGLRALEAWYKKTYEMENVYWGSVWEAVWAFTLEVATIKSEAAGQYRFSELHRIMRDILINSMPMKNAEVGGNFGGLFDTHMIRIAQIRACLSFIRLTEIKYFDGITPFNEHYFK